MITVTRTKAKHFLTKSKLNDGLTCNPYSGCQHGCLYCYANYMVPGRSDYDAWGKAVEIREYPNLDIPRNTGAKPLIFSSATDAYQPIEATERSMRRILEAIHESDLKVKILTKGALVERDVDIFRRMRSLEVGFSLSLDDRAARIFEPGASAPSARISALRQLKTAGLKTYVFIAPIFPHLTDVFALIETLRADVDYFMFDTLNLSHPHNRQKILEAIRKHYPEHYPAYVRIFMDKDKTYYQTLKQEISGHMDAHGLDYTYIYP